MMTWTHHPALFFGFLFLGAAALPGCTPSEPTTFYTLSAPVSDRAPGQTRPMRLGIGPVTFPAYLDRPQLVTRNGPNQMEVADFHQWIEPLKSTFQRVLEQDLANRFAIDQVVSLPGRRDLPIDHQIEIDVIRFDADASGEVVLDARWRIFGKSGDRTEDSGHFMATRQASLPGDYRSIAEAMSRCLGSLSAELARALDGL